MLTNDIVYQGCKENSVSVVLGENARYCSKSLGCIEQGSLALIGCLSPRTGNTCHHKHHHSLTAE